MQAIFMLLAAVFWLGSLVCGIIILIDAFRDELWKGLLCLLCGLYGLYYAIFEFDHENKWLIVLGSFFGSGIGAVLMQMALPAQK